MKYEWLDSYLLSKQGATKDFKIEWQWQRYLVNDKLFAAICIDKDGNDIITLKLHPLNGIRFRESYKDVKPGFYMNKDHWNSINLNGIVEDDILKNMIDESYHLVVSSLSKKMQNELKLNK